MGPASGLSGKDAPLFIPALTQRCVSTRPDAAELTHGKAGATPYASNLRLLAAGPPEARVLRQLKSGM